MSDSLADLEGRRANVQARIAQLGDMRSGSITGRAGVADMQTVIVIALAIRATARTIA